MSDRATTWSLTLNNPTAADEEDIARARQRGWKVDGQLEKGENGTPHYQLILKTPQVRFSAVKKAFPRAHIEIARNPAALSAYVQKDDTRVSALPSSSEMYPSLSKFWMLIYQRCERYNWLNWGDDHFRRWWKDAFDFFGVSRFEYDDWSRPAPTEKMKEEFAMLVFTNLVGELIKEGYHVEHFYSPPNISVFKKFHFSILHRAYVECSAQTDRQTDNALDPQEVNVPTIHTNAIDEEGLSQEAHQSSQTCSPSSPGLPPPSDSHP